jgi:hypothetical protein
LNWCSVFSWTCFNGHVSDLWWVFVVFLVKLQPQAGTRLYIHKTGNLNYYICRRTVEQKREGLTCPETFIFLDDGKQCNLDMSQK